MLKPMLRRLDPLGALSATAAMVALGGAFAVTPLLLSYPVYAGQTLRYGVAALILTALAQAGGRARLAVSARELVGLTALALTGLVAFNVALIEGLRSLDPATMGTVVGASPIVLATLGPLVEGRRLSYRLVAAALVVVVGSALTYGAGPASGRGLVFALVALGGEASFSLIALPLLPRLGPLVLSAYVTGLASALLAVAAVVVVSRAGRSRLRRQSRPPRWPIKRSWSRPSRFSPGSRASHASVRRERVCSSRCCP
jgi:drug/metabolite transporter (DMT)-like permease